MFLIHHWISSQGRYDLFDTCPYIKFLYVKPTILTKLEIKAKFRAKQASFYEMQNLKTQVKSRISVSRSSLRCITFRVSPVMTTSIPVLILYMYSVSEKCKGNMEERMGFEPTVQYYCTQHFQCCALNHLDHLSETTILLYQ